VTTTGSHTHSTSTLPARVTTPLLQLITQQSMDEDYEHVAEQRRAGARPPAEPTGRGVRTLVAVLLFGALIAVAAVQTARNAHVTSAGREQLISRISVRRASLADVQDRIARLQSDNAAAETAIDDAGKRLDALSSTRANDQVKTGFGALTGSGVRAVVDDAPGGGQAGKVQDNDLALLVNGLWRAGATGISVNGQRVTALSALRNTAQVIRINDVSLSPPYTVLAVGDTKTMQADFADSAAGSLFQATVDQYGMRFTWDIRDKMRLPPAPAGMMALHKAKSIPPKQQKSSVNQEGTQ
jgi:uncharacterized protein YlxW (UPF0749 family)